MKSTSKMTKELLVWGGLLLVFTFVGQAGAQTCVPAPSGLVSWLPGDGNADDIVGTNDGTLQNGATFALGLVGQAFSFDGTSSVTLSSLPAVSNLGSWTYDIWINVSSYTNGSIQAGDGSYFIDRTSETLNLADLKAVNNQFAFQVRYDDGTGLGGPVGGAINGGVWTHIAMVREFGVAFRLYVDGSLVASTADNGNSLTPPIPKLGHHALPTLLGFEGLIDEFEIFDRALSQSEIQAIVNAGSAGKCKVTTVPFAAFQAKVEIKDDEFEVKAFFTLGAGSNGIDPVTEIVQLELTGGTGSFVTTIPAGSFEFQPAKFNKKGQLVRAPEFKFEGVIDGVALEAKITDLGGGAFEFKAQAEGSDLMGIANPVTVSLTVGDDGGSASVDAEFD